MLVISEYFVYVKNTILNEVVFGKLLFYKKEKKLLTKYFTDGIISSDRKFIQNIIFGL